MKETYETIAVEGGADGKTQQAAWDNTCNLIYQAIRTIPRKHRLGWWQATLRHANQPTTPQPTPAESAYHDWSQHQHTSPNKRSRWHSA